MKYIDKIKYIIKKKKPARRLSSRDAYGIWYTFYDDQPDNTVLFLEEKLFSEMISNTDIKNRNILDFGCGTGRHWKEILDHKPLKLTGIDNSHEMTGKLKMKFKDAEVFVSEKLPREFFNDPAFDIIISTLTIGHIKNIDQYFQDWNRILKAGGEILITDFHPAAFSAGMKRSFPHKDEVIEVENYLYEIEYLKKIFSELGWVVISIFEKKIDDEVRHLFEKQNFMKAYNKFFGTPLISGIHLKKS
ncbi:MAG TPA: methyltransferase domain-containing protein [Ignavibacteria bacterium]|nr:methyltransferase domain-containing protein [Ignavibacteria bacterium]